MLEVELPEALDGQRLDRVVALLTGCTRAESSAAVDAGQVSVDGEVVTARAARVRGGQRLELAAHPARGAALPRPDPGVPVEVVADDPHLVVVDKPAGLVVHPGPGHPDGTLVNGLLARYPEIAGVGDPQRPGIVHRLDAGTSGLLVVARTPRAYDALVADLAARRVGRRYLALVWGRVEHDAGLVDAPVGRSEHDPQRMAVSARGREARTRYEVRRRFAEPRTTLLGCELETGRTHQIRVHLSAIGHPVVGDARYGGHRPPLHPGRPALHAAALALRHPVTGEALRWERPLPPDLAELLAGLVPEAAEGR